MSKWQYIKNKTTKVTCYSDTQHIGSTEYYGCCSKCDYAKGEYGDHWLNDKIWCACPVPIKQGQTIEINECFKYRTIKNEQRNG
jgi:hypothetical protein